MKSASTATDPTASKPVEITLLDGGMGQELITQGMADGLLWSAQSLIDDPALVSEVHASYIAAGSQVITTNTYALGQARLEHLDMGHQFVELNQLAGQLAASAASEAPGRTVRVAGSLPPYRGSYQPESVAPYEVLVGEYTAQAQALAPYVELFLVETMSTIDEARAAVAGANAALDGLSSSQRAGRRPEIWVSWTMTGDDHGNIASGESLADAVAAVKADAYLVNCADPERITGGLKALLAATAKPVGAYANGFVAIPKGWSLLDGDPLPPPRVDLTPEHYARFVGQWIEMGAKIVGGCCEVGPSHIAALAEHCTG